jgi:hypothetical protein
LLTKYFLSSKYSKLLHTESAAEHESAYARAELPSSNERSAEVSAEERKLQAERELSKNLLERFFQAGALYDAIASMLDQVLWRPRLFGRTIRWSWTELPDGNIGGLFFSDLLVAATFAYRQYSAMWPERMKLGRMERGKNAAQYRAKLAAHVLRLKACAPAYACSNAAAEPHAAELGRGEDENSGAAATASDME